MEQALRKFTSSGRKELVMDLSSKNTPKLARLLVPGVFLLLLGLGNIGVGVYKGAEYQQVINELSAMKPRASQSEARLVHASPIKRIQLNKNKSQRLEQRQLKARARLDFYGLVSFGGKVMLSISTIILSVATWLYFSRPK